MNISEVKIKLLGNDILSIINEFVRIKDLELKNVIIDDGITLEGSFKKSIVINFSIKIELIECINNKLAVRIVKVKILNLGFLKFLGNFALRKLAKEFKEYGIESQKDKVIININKLLKDVPYIDFNINEIFMKRSEIWIEASDINVSITGGLIKKIEAEEVENEDDETIEALGITNKTQDSYSIGRELLEDKLPEVTKKYKDYIFIVPDIVSLIYRLLKDKRVPIKTKIMMATAITYITIPNNIIPRKIPFIGAIDDVGVVLFVLNKILNDVPLAIVVENWQGKNELLLVLKNGIEYLIDFTGARNVEKLYDIVEELSATL